MIIIIIICGFFRNTVKGIQKTPEHYREHSERTSLKTII